MKKPYRPTVRFMATPEQLKKLQPIARAIDKNRGAVFGQVIVAENPEDEKIGTVRFHYVDVKRALILQAIIKFLEDVK